MQIAYTLDMAEQLACESYGGSKKVVGLMLANYDAKLVKDVVAKCYSAWGYESASDIDIYWLGYSQYVFNSEPAQKREKSTLIVNFNQTEDVQKVYRLADYGNRTELDSLLKKLDNSTCVAFDRLAYTSSKNEIRKRMRVGKEQKIDSLTLIFVEYFDGRFHFENGRYLAVNLHTLKDSSDPVTDINDLVSSLISYCGESDDYEQLLKKIRKELQKDKKGPDIIGWIGIGISILNAILRIIIR